MVAQFFEGWWFNCAGSGPTPGVAPCEESSAEPLECATETETVECLKADKKEKGAGYVGHLGRRVFNWLFQRFVSTVCIY